MRTIFTVPELSGTARRHMGQLKRSRPGRRQRAKDGALAQRAPRGRNAALLEAVNRLQGTTQAGLAAEECRGAYLLLLTTVLVVLTVLIAALTAVLASPLLP